MADDMDKDNRNSLDCNKNQQTNHNMSGDTHPFPANTSTQQRDSYWFAHGGVDEPPANSQNSSKPPDPKDAQSQKEREERIRQFREQQEEERLKRMKELEQTFLLSRKFREHQEEERRRKIEEARVKENERRQQVEERKRQIWEAEQERKEAILRRNLEREARIEARRNAQRNSLCFAFGSSTPRTFDLDLAALGRSSGAGCPLMSSVSGRRSEERDFGAKRATSACSLDRKPEDFDLSMGSENSAGTWNDHWRSMSFERDCSPANIAKQIAIEHMKSEQTKACLTMDDNLSVGAGSTSLYLSCPSSRWLTGSGAVVGDDCMSWSTTSLSSASRRRRRTDLMPVTPRERSTTPNTNTRAKNHSPSRPQSSMSGRSENSVTSSQASFVSLRPKVAPRKPRPVSIAGSTVDRSTWNSTPAADRKPRPNERSAAVSVPKPPRARSTEPDNVLKTSTPPKKPVPPPKSAEVLAKARSHPVPTKDNLRKNVKPVPAAKPAVAVAAVKTPVKETSPVPVNMVPEPPAPEQVQEVILPVESQPETLDVPKEPPKDDAEKKEPPKIEPVAVQQPESKPEEPFEKAESPEKVDETLSDSNTVGQIQTSDSAATKARITSEEEARAALAEKRRLAREQAEREAELERQRQEELQRQEEERRRQEELELKRQEEEQIRLAELHRQMEEEKLRKAIEERELREQEEKERREEEARLKAEKEEQERKAREEAERQRIELEERLRKEEQERAERKRRVEQIMSRTRGKGSPSVNSPSQNKDVLSPSENNSERVQAPTSQEVNQESKFQNANLIGVIQNNINNNTQNGVGNGMSSLTSDSSVISSVGEESSVTKSSLPSQPYDSNSLVHNENVKNGFHSESTEQTFINSVNSVPKRTSIVDSAYTTQTNGYSSHEDTSMISSPEERSEKSDSSEGLLLDLQSTQSSGSVTKLQTEINQLIDIGSENATTNSHNENYMIDVVNSNSVSTNNPFLAYEDNLPKKQENTITDLLS